MPDSSIACSSELAIKLVDGELRVGGVAVLTDLPEAIFEHPNPISSAEEAIHYPVRGGVDLSLQSDWGQ
jgi:hypothetical protein